MTRTHLSAVLQALAAALLFGASAPIAKLLLGEIKPIPLAAFLYLGSGLGLSAVKLYQRFGERDEAQEAQIRRADLPWLLGAILAGGVAAPITLLFSLQNTPAATASLLLNFEGVATTLIAFVAFNEAISRRAWGAIGLMTLASILLSLNLNGEWGFSLGALGILAACVLWGLDNNFTRNICAKDPLVIVTIKGLGAGSFSLVLALIQGHEFPSWGSILGALGLGSLSYGVSIVLFIHAMRGLGAARTSALFSTAPIAGILLSFIFFQEMPGWLFVIALPIMVVGAVLFVNEAHEHAHTHTRMMHDHAHSHEDDHHAHAHAGDFSGKHSHPHRHASLTHTHPHMPDIHHRHIHPAEV